MELLSENADRVVQLLVNYAQSSGARVPLSLHADHANTRCEQRNPLTTRC